MIENLETTTYDLIWDEDHPDYSTSLPEQVKIPNDRDVCNYMDYLGDQHNCFILHWFESEDE